MSVPPDSVAANHTGGRHIQPMSDISDIGHSEEFAPQLVATGWRPFDEQGRDEDNAACGRGDKRVSYPTAVGPPHRPPDDRR